MHVVKGSIGVLAVICLTHVAAAQDPFPRPTAGDILGMSLTLSGTSRDTLGLLVASVVAGGPAERAGIIQGNRVGDIAGVSLRVDPADVGQQGVQDQVMRRLARAQRVSQSSEAVSVRIVSGTRERTIEVPTGNGHMATAQVVNPIPESPPGLAIGASVNNAGTRAPETSAPTLPIVTAAIEQQRMLLRRLARSEEADVTSDSLVRIEQDLRAIVKRLRDIQGAGEKTHQEQQPAAPPPTAVSSDSASPALPGLRVAPVGADLEYYFGEGSQGGLIILTADSTWAPLHNGDILIRIDGQSVDPARLRAALVSSEPVAIEILRQRRRMLLTLHGTE
jgi:hypothetical protein